MEDVYLVNLGVGLLLLTTQGMMLFLQWRMLKRHGHACFKLLCGASVCGICYAVLAWLPEFVQLDQTSFRMVFLGSVVLTVAAASLGVWGTVTLFRSYDGLASNTDPKR